MAKKLIYGSEAREKLLEGVNDNANAVKATMGAKGRNVLIGNVYGNTPISSKDGVTVSKSIQFKDMEKDMGSVLIKDVCKRTNETSGDGTTCSAVLAQSIINLGVNAIDKGANPQEIKKGVDLAVTQVVKYVKSISKKVDSNNADIKHIATISANNNEEIGKLIAEAVMQTGNEGKIIVEPSSSYETILEKVEGLQVNKGFLSPYFVNKQDKEKCEFINPYILLCDTHIQSAKEVLPLIEDIVKSGRPLLIFCDDLSDEGLQFIVSNVVAKRLNVCVVKCEEFGSNRKQIMDDVATVTGGIFITEATGIKLSKVKLVQDSNSKNVKEFSYLGQADKVIVDKDKTLIIGGKGGQEKIAELAKNLQSQLKTEGGGDNQFLKTRLAKILNGVAILRIGGVSEIEIGEKSDLIDDALQATKSAIEEGIVAGGGSTFIKAIEHIKYPLNANKDLKKGMDIIAEAIAQPFRQILINAGYSDSGRIFSQSPIEGFIEEIKRTAYGYGMNIKTDKMENLLTSGIIDPTKVLRCALENSASVAGTFLLTEVVISDILK